MSLNKAHYSGGGVIFFYGESLLIYYKGCDINFEFPENHNLNCSTKGSVYLTTHRTICITKHQSLQSISMPLLNMKQVEVKQPIFGANRIEGKVVAEADGGFSGMAKFSLTFNRGGAIEFAQCLMEAGKRANANRHSFNAPPPYSAMDASQLYQPPPPQYMANGCEYSFLTQHEAFATPDTNSVYMYPAPPPYPGASIPPPYPTQQQMPTAYYNTAQPQAAHMPAPNNSAANATSTASAGVQPSAPPSYEETVNSKQHHD